MDNNELNKNKLLKAKKALLTFGVAGAMVGGYCLGSKNIKPSDNVTFYCEKQSDLEQSNSKNYYGNESKKTDIPQNVTLSDKYIATWDKVDNAEWYYALIKYEESDSIINAYEVIGCLNVHSKPGKLSCDMSSYILAGCKYLDLYEKNVDVSIAIRAVTSKDNVHHKEGSYSKYSNSVEYYMENPIKLDTPENVTLSDKYIATWDKVKNADCYNAVILYESDDKVDTYVIKYLNVKNVFGKVYCDLSEYISHGYDSLDLYGEDANILVSINADVYMYSNKNCVESLYSSYSNEFIHANSLDRVLVKSK